MKLCAKSQMLKKGFVLPEPGPSETAWAGCTVTVATSAEGMTGEAE